MFDMEVAHHAHGAIGIGYEGKTIDEFIRDLVASNTKVLFDVRLNPISRKSGFSKKALAAALADAGINYCHTPQLGNPTWNRPGFSGTSDEVRAARKNFNDMITSETGDATLRQIADAATSDVVAVMCVEADDRACHRYVILNEVRSMALKRKAII